MSLSPWTSRSLWQKASSNMVFISLFPVVKVLLSLIYVSRIHNELLHHDLYKVKFLTFSKVAINKRCAFHKIGLSENKLREPAFYFSSEQKNVILVDLESIKLMRPNPFQQNFCLPRWKKPALTATTATSTATTTAATTAKNNRNAKNRQERLD